jgi:hypothetical protein
VNKDKVEVALYMSMEISDSMLSLNQARSTWMRSRESSPDLTPKVSSMSLTKTRRVQCIDGQRADVNEFLAL